MNRLTRPERQLIEAVWRHYKDSGRHELPWRQTTDPYRIVVSEIMLQQTQVSRVIPKYQVFLKRFLSTKQLAGASLAEVLGYWQGLGYNRRAKMLWQAAAVVREQYNGRWPSSEAGLRQLPGIGVYTSRAVVAFAFDHPALLLETNIKTVLLVHCFPGDAAVTEKQLYEVLARVADSDRPREWYWAMMDYGAYLKAEHPKVHQRVRGYRPQSTFRGSDREIRGAILRYLHTTASATQSELLEALSFASARIQTQLRALAKEGMVEEVTAQTWQLPR